MERLAKILVVENEQNIRKLARANLTASGYQVVVAADGEEGLRVAQLTHPDLILLDLMMPGMSGWDVLMTLKADQNLHKTPVIIMTASPRAGNRDKARGLGTAGYLTKPFSIDELLRRIKQAIG